jgi:hemoglobin-like flavoprotein
MGGVCSSDETKKFVPTMTIEERYELTRTSFEAITGGTAKGFLKHLEEKKAELEAQNPGQAEGLARKNTGLLPSPGLFFYDTFYTTLFKLSPGCEQFFSNGGNQNLQARAAALMRMIKAMLDVNSQEEKSLKMVKAVANGHSKNRKIQSSHFVQTKSALCKTLEICLGEEGFTMDVHTAWKETYDYLMSLMLPIIIANNKADIKAGNMEEVL